VTTVHVYVEGPSDRAAMEALLAPLLDDLQRRSVAVQFFYETSGDRKKAVLLKVPEKAVNILRNRPEDRVVALPDLYPKNHGFPHSTADELTEGVRHQFRAILARKGIHDQRLESRFHVFCFKHDLEALVLAAFEPLKARLDAPELRRTWRLPVEEVNHGRPPKRVVEDLFREHRQIYRETVDAPLILGGASHLTLVEECPQCFAPFVRFLESL
jgi:hypothetical protein